MAFNCDQIRTELERQTPVFDEVFQNDFISNELAQNPFTGRHQTKTWTDGKDTLIFSTVHVQQPNYTTEWERINGEECANPCEPPMTTVGHGTSRDSVFMEQLDLNSQPWCLQQMRTVPHIGEQITQIYNVLKSFPNNFNSNFLRSRFTSYHDTLQVATKEMLTVPITTANTTPGMSILDVGSALNLPDSKLTLGYLRALQQQLAMRGYNQKSGLPAGMINLVTHQSVYQDLVGLNPELRSQLYPQDMSALSPFYKIGVGINANPFGFIAPTFDDNQMRFQLASGGSGGRLQRVYPYTNVAATTGGKPEVNLDYLRARWAVSYIIHPFAATFYTSAPRKIHSMVPSINTAMFGKWQFVNNQGIIRLYNPDGSYCDKDNANQFWFYWRVHLEAGFRYNYRYLVMPILHQIDGDGSSCLVNVPACGSYPTYATQYMDGSSLGFCET